MSSCLEIFSFCSIGIFFIFIELALFWFLYFKNYYFHWYQLIYIYFYGSQESTLFTFYFSLTNRNDFLLKYSILLHSRKTGSTKAVLSVLVLLWYDYMLFFFILLVKFFKSVTFGEKQHIFLETFHLFYLMQTMFIFGLQITLFFLYCQRGNKLW